MGISVIVHYYLHRDNDIPEFHMILIMENVFNERFQVVDKVDL